jgi:hypothetical protein
MESNEGLAAVVTSSIWEDRCSVSGPRPGLEQRRGHVPGEISRMCTYSEASLSVATWTREKLWCEQMRSQPGLRLPPVPPGSVHLSPVLCIWIWPPLGGVAPRGVDLGQKSTVECRLEYLWVGARRSAVPCHLTPCLLPWGLDLAPPGLWNHYLQGKRPWILCE